MSTVITIMTNMISAISTVQSNTSNPASVEALKTSATNMFIATVLWTVIAAFIGAFLAWQLWRANRAYQDVVKTEANARLEEAKLQLETEKLNRIELEKTLSRRSIPLIMLDGKTNIDGIRPFAGMQAIIEYLPDMEARRASAEIAQALTHANWKLIGGGGENPDLALSMWDGVVVESYLGNALGLSGEALAQLGEDRKRASTAAEALVKLLVEHNWAAHRFPDGSNLPPNTIKIKVGFKPVPKLKTKLEEEYERRVGQEPKPLAAERTEQRQITATQRESILKSLARIKQISEAGGVTIYKIPPTEVRCPANNKEACAFADELAKLLRDNGWPIKENSAIRDTDFPRKITGILIREKAGDVQGWANGDLYRALKAAGFEVEQDEDRMTFTDSLQILVGW